MSALNIGGGRAGGISMFPSGSALASSLTRWSGDIRSFEPVLRRIVKEVVKPRIEENFIKETEAGDKKWDKLAEITPFIGYRQMHNAADNPILDVTGKLKRVALQDNIWTFDNRAGVAFVRDLPGAEYGRAQQHGAPNYGLSGGLADIPARPFIIIRREDIDRAEEIVKAWVAENFTKRVAGGVTVGSLVGGE